MDGVGAQFGRFATFRFASGIRFAHEYARAGLDDSAYYVVAPLPYRVVIEDLAYNVSMEEGQFDVAIEDLGMRPEVHRPPRGGRERERW